MSETKTVKILGYEWCRPVGTALLDDYVTVGFSDGWLALCRVEQDVDTGDVRRIMIRPEELNRADG